MPIDLLGTFQKTEDTQALYDFLNNFNELKHSPTGAEGKTEIPRKKFDVLAKVELIYEVLKKDFKYDSPALRNVITIYKTNMVDIDRKGRTGIERILESAFERQRDEDRKGERTNIDQLLGKRTS